MPLTPREVQRYVRQLLLPEIGLPGQERLASARVLLAGEGLAVEVARDYLARAGVGLSADEARSSSLCVNASGPQGSARFALSDRGFARSDGAAPCLGCLQGWLDDLPSPPIEERAALAMAAGALGASELLIVALGRRTQAAFPHAVGYAFWPAAVRREVKPRPACACDAVARG